MYIHYLFDVFLFDRGTLRELTSDLTRRRGVLDCSVNLICTLRTFTTLAPETSLVPDHITRSLGSESNHRKQVASSNAVYTLTHFGRCSVLQILKSHGLSKSLNTLLTPGIRHTDDQDLSNNDHSIQIMRGPGRDLEKPCSAYFETIDEFNERSQEVCAVLASRPSWLCGTSSSECQDTSVSQSKGTSLADHATRKSANDIQATQGLGL